MSYSNSLAYKVNARKNCIVFSKFSYDYTCDVTTYYYRLIWCGNNRKWKYTSRCKIHARLSRVKPVKNYWDRDYESKKHFFNEELLKEEELWKAREG